MRPSTHPLFRYTLRHTRLDHRRCRPDGHALLAARIFAADHPRLCLAMQDAAPNYTTACGDGPPPASGFPPTWPVSRGPGAGRSVHPEDVRVVCHRQFGMRSGIIDQRPVVQQPKVDVRQRKEHQKQARRRPGALGLGPGLLQDTISDLYALPLAVRLWYVHEQIPGVVHPYVGDERYVPVCGLGVLGGVPLGHTTSVEVDCLPSLLVMVYSRTGPPPPPHRPHL